MINQKDALLSSMIKLVNQINSGPQARAEIFACLQAQDFLKIIRNLSNPIAQIRLMSAQLLASLLYQSPSLQQKFCLLMGIHYCRETELVLNNNLGEIFSRCESKTIDAVKLMRSHHKIRDKGSNSQVLLWFINTRSRVLRIEYLCKQQMNECLRKMTQMLNNEERTFDPAYCIFGVLINSGEIPKDHLITTSTHNTLKGVAKEAELHKIQPEQTKKKMKQQRIFNIPDNLKIAFTEKKTARHATPSKSQTSRKKSAPSFIKIRMQNTARQYKTPQNLQEARDCFRATIEPSTTRLFKDLPSQGKNSTLTPQKHGQKSTEKLHETQPAPMSRVKNIAMNGRLSFEMNELLKTPEKKTECGSLLQNS